MNATIVFITQNLFVSSPDFRTISLNANQIVMFKTLRGMHQIEHLGRQIFGKRQASEFLEAYKTATRKPFSYLLLDLQPDQTHRLRSRIFPEEEELVYILE